MKTLECKLIDIKYKNMFETVYRAQTRQGDETIILTNDQAKGIQLNQTYRITGDASNDIDFGNVLIVTTLC